jgi:hypothetical protein
MVYYHVVAVSYLRDLKVRLHIAVSVVHAAQVIIRASDNALSIATHSALKLVKDAVILVQVTQLFGTSSDAGRYDNTIYNKRNVSASYTNKSMLLYS